MTPPGAPSREDRFRALYAEHYDPVVRFARRRTGPDDADDVTAETFLVAWRRLEHVPTRPGEALPWLYAVARHCLLNAARSSVRQQALAVRVADDEPASFSDSEIDAATARVDLASSWRQLTPEDQETLALALFEDLPSTQAARVLGITSAAYRVRLSRARRRLRALISPAEPGPTGATVRPMLKELS